MRYKAQTERLHLPQFDALAALVIYANDHVAWLYLLITAALRGSHFAARVYARHKRRRLRTSAHVRLASRWRSDIQRFAMTRSTSFSVSHLAVLLTQVQFAATWEFRSEYQRTYIQTSSGLRQSRIVASLRRTLLHCHGIRTAFLPRRFRETPEPAILISQFLASAHTDAIKSETRDLRIHETNSRKFRDDGPKYHELT